MPVKKVFSENEFRHSLDADSAKKIVQSSAVETVMRIISENDLERIYDYIYKSSSVRLTKEMAPDIIDTLEQVCEMFGLSEVPEIYVQWSYEKDDNIMICGYSAPFIVISSQYLDRLSSQMLTGVLAAQVAGIKLEHHKTMFLAWVIELATQFNKGIQLIASGIINQWKRFRHYSCDRAFFLATGDLSLTLQYLLIDTLDQNAVDLMHPGKINDQYHHQIRAFEEVKPPMKAAQYILTDKSWIPDRYKEVEAFCRGRR